jgi:hypothetical protein
VDTIGNIPVGTRINRHKFKGKTENSIRGNFLPGIDAIT